VDILELRCWSCGETTSMEEGLVAQALAHMEEAQQEFFDVPCSHCEKINRAKKEVFVEAYLSRQEQVRKAARVRKNKKKEG
jgi:tRNA U54 and U55 pseudouridine synthase Pus10